MEFIVFCSVYYILCCIVYCVVYCFVLYVLHSLAYTVLYLSMRHKSFLFLEKEIKFTSTLTKMCRLLPNQIEVHVLE